MVRFRSLGLLRIAVLILLGHCASHVSGCRSGWLQHDDVCYHFSHDKESWASAETMCRLLGGTLATIQSDSENHFLQTEVERLQPSKTADDRYWIGASDIQIEGEWRWTALGELIGYSNWSSTQPDNAGGNENCVEIKRSGFWNDNQCMKQTYYICEERPETEGIIG